MLDTLSPYNLLNGLGLIAGLFLLDQALERRASDCRDRAYILFVLAAALAWLSAHIFDAFVTRQAFRDAGFTYYGGLLGGAAAFLLGSRHWLSRDQLLRSLNCAIVPLLVAHGIGRVGCFFAGCCYGRLVGEHFRHPTQLYEATFLLLLAAVAAHVQHRHFLSGLRLYLFAYPTFRFAIEFLRADDRGSLYSLSTSQWISLGLLSFTAVWTCPSRKATTHLIVKGLAEARHEPSDCTLVEQARRNPRECWPCDLPVVEEVLDPQGVKEAPQSWRFIGAEVSEQLDYEPAKFLRRRLIRNKYVSRKDLDLAPVIAKLPPSLQECCLAAPRLLAAIIVGKYCDHLPLYRQESIFLNRHGVSLPRQSMARYMGLCSEWLQPIYDAIGKEVLSGGYVQVDETPISYLSPGHGQTKLGYLWTTCRPRGDVFLRWEVSRGAECLKNFIPVDFTGTIQCDAYGAYPSCAREHDEPITLAGCWAHARRKFYEAKEQSPQQAGFILAQIGHLYRVEARLRDQKAGPRLRESVRSSQSVPIYRRIQHYLALLKKEGRYLPRSSMGKAIDYSQCLCLSGPIPLRPCVLTRASLL